MKLYIEHLAKIEKADIELNGITLIAGENNTGKSSVGKALYCIFSSFYNFHEQIRKEKADALLSFLSIRSKGRRGSISDLREKFIERILNIESNIYIQKESLQSTLSELLKEEEFNRLDEINAYIFEILNMKDERVMYTITKKYFDEEFQGQIQSFYHTQTPSVEVQMKNERICLDLSKHHVEDYVNVFHRLIYIDNPDFINGRRLRFSRARYNHNDKLSFLLSTVKSEQTLFDELISEDIFSNVMKKLNEVLHGEFVVTDQGLAFQEEGSSIPLLVENLSMGLKGFAMIRKLIEDGHIQKNGILVLDEPEVHLHPKWQLIYAEILVILQKELNLTILLTSHSPYFINAIEVYSAKHQIADQCKYYLSDVIDRCAVFEDVTTNIEKIYKKLALPLQELEDIE